MLSYVLSRGDELDMLPAITETINALTEVLIIQIYLSKIMIVKNELQQIKWLPQAVVSIIMALSAILVKNSSIQLAITVFLIFAWEFIFYNGSLFRKLFSTLVFIIVMITSDAVFVAILYIFNLGEPTELLSTGMGRILGMIGSKLFAFWLVVVFTRIYNKKTQELPIKYWIVMLSMPFLSTVVLYSMFTASFSSDKNAVIYLMSVVCILLFNFFVFNFFDTYTAQIRLDLLEQKAKLDDENYKYMNAVYTEIRQIKHDLKNQIKITEELFYNGNHRQALEHLKKYTSEISGIGDVCYTGISPLDAVINLKGKAASEKGILFQTKISVKEPMQIDEFVLCRILGNALDNAIEACERVDFDNKFILLSLIQNEDKILKISLLNSSHEMADEYKFITEKNDTKLHGFGLSIMQKSVKKLGGIMSVDYSKGVFALNMLIKYK